MHAIARSESETLVKQDPRVGSHRDGRKSAAVTTSPTARVALAAARACSFPVARTAVQARLLPCATLTLVLLVACDGEAGARGAFSAAIAMKVERHAHTATLLPNGTALVVGGISGFALSSAERYNPASGKFTLAGTLAVARYSHTATLLPTGKVLVVGGADGSFDSMIFISTAELYDPASGTFTATGSMNAVRLSHTATLLPSGKVLIAGGNSGLDASSSAELYDPESGSFIATGIMTTTKMSHTATLLSNGKVLLAGGLSGLNISSSAELYDPERGVFVVAGAMGVIREGHTATLLPDGKVLLAGGVDSSAELYDPVSGTFTPTGSMTTERRSHTATLLLNRKVLVAGGGGDSSAELYY